MEQMLTTVAVARLLGIFEGSVRALEGDGRLPAIRTESGIRLFTRADVEEFKALRARQAERSARHRPGRRP